MEIERALKILGGIRAGKQTHTVLRRRWVRLPSPIYWLDGKENVEARVVIRAALEVEQKKGDRSRRG